MFRKNEQGQAIVILAIGMVVLLVFAALAIDAGNAYTAKRVAQNAADASAMSGTRQLALECARQGLTPGPNATKIIAEVDKMAAANNLSTLPGGGVQEIYYLDDSGVRMGAVNPLAPVPCGCGPGAARGIEVVASNPTQSFLAGLMGQDVLGTKAGAKARYAPMATASTGLYPITGFVPDAAHPLKFNEIVVRAITDEPVPGNFGWLSWNGDNNVPNLAESLTPPGDSGTKYYNPGTPENGWTPNYGDKAIQIGKWVQGAPGNMNASSVRAKLDWFKSTQTPLIVPLYDMSTAQGSNANFRVGGFAAFRLTDYDLHPNGASITGAFIKMVGNGEWAEGVTCDHETGLYSIKLTP
jgi:hypothetical protein